MKRRHAVVASVLAAGSLAVVARADASIVARPLADGGAVLAEGGTREIVVWDDAAKTERLIRTVSASGDPSSFGVLVPTPSKPRVAREDASIFAPFTDAAPTAPALEDFETASFRADDPSGIYAYLLEHGYAATGNDGGALDVRAWLAPYASKGFAITVARFAGGDAGVRAVSTPILGYTFRADEPFVPASAASAGAGRLFYVGRATGVAGGVGHALDPADRRALGLEADAGGTYVAAFDAPAEDSIVRTSPDGIVSLVSAASASPPGPERVVDAGATPSEEAKGADGESDAGATSPPSGTRNGSGNGPGRIRAFGLGTALLLALLGVIGAFAVERRKQI